MCWRAGVCFGGSLEPDLQPSVLVGGESQANAARFWELQQGEAAWSSPPNSLLKVVSVFHTRKIFRSSVMVAVLQMICSILSL